MSKYSHSKIKTYKNCPYQYKLKYIDRLRLDYPTTIENFMGDLVHRTLEKLYKDKKFQKRVTLISLIKFYKEMWEREYSDDILVVKEKEGLTTENYRKMGLKYIKDYYNRMKPFDQLTILGLETEDIITLPDGNKWNVRIDKLACDNKGNYYVCDYKTNSKMMDQSEADSDMQLALYSIWVKDKFKDAKKVILKWHMLAFNKDAVSERTDKQLKDLQEEVITIIKKIEIATKKEDFPRNQTALCDYCIYKDMCPSFKHLAEIEEKPTEEFKEDEGVKLVDEFSEIKTNLNELKKKEDEFKEKLIKYAKQFDIDIVYGSNKKCSVKEFEKIVLPEDSDERQKFIDLLKEKGLWEEFSMICYYRLNSKILNGEVDKDVVNMTNKVKDFRLNLSKRKDMEEE